MIDSIWESRMAIRNTIMGSMTNFNFGPQDENIAKNNSLRRINWKIWNETNEIISDVKNDIDKEISNSRSFLMLG